MNTEKIQQKITESLDRQIEKLDTYDVDRLMSEALRLEKENRLKDGSYRSVLIDQFNTTEQFYRQTIKRLLEAVKVALKDKIMEDINANKIK
jgi:spore germination cell wall hydrolase CwlJ-like protein